MTESINSTENNASDVSQGEAFEPIAIIGMAGRFPGAANIDAFWENLRNGVESVKFFTDEELANANIEAELLANPKFVRADAVLDDIDQFDANFFNYSHREAEIMDPQHRLFMEEAWSVLEHAGYDVSRYEGRVGVYGGSGLSSYLIRNLLKNSDYVKSVGSFQTMLGNSQDFLTTKVSFKMNLTGPSVNCNTLCSSSMVGVHLACASLWNFDTDLCIAGGVSIQSSRNEAFFYQEGGIGAFDGHCRAFDAKARGTVSGSGLGVLVLKRFEDALADGDTIHALIRGSAINNDGSAKISYTAPNPDGQAEVITEAMEVGNVDPASISYVECHGTGTSLGDPIEILGLTKAFRLGTPKTQFCAVGSVKTNIGHLVTAGGVASMIKTVLALKHRSIPPSLNYEQPNPKIDFANSPFYVADKLLPWESKGGEPRRAGVSSFGIGGTNAHVILEEAPQQQPTPASRGNQLLVLSATTESALADGAANLKSFLLENPETNLADVAFTLQMGRKAFGYRHFVVAETVTDAVEKLSTARMGTVFREETDRQPVFMFSGQGSQYPGMTRGLYQSLDVFRHWVDRCCDLLTEALKLDLRDLLYPEQDGQVQAGEKLQQTRFTQPALFTVEYALAQQLMAWGIKPSAMIGHSIGEYVAACLAGVFSLEEVLSLVALRGSLIQSLPPGDMVAVPLSEAELEPWLSEDLSLAAVNGPSNCVVSGSPKAVTVMVEKLKTQGHQGRLLHTSHGFHSAMMEPILKPFEDKVRSLAPKPPRIPYISNVTGTWITAEEACRPGYYGRHLRQGVRFYDGLSALFEKQEPLLVEVGPGRTLVALARQHPEKKAATTTVQCIRHPREARSDQNFLYGAMGMLWQAGGAVDFKALHRDERRRIPLPTYPFQRRSYWIEPDMDSYGRLQSATKNRAGVRKSNPAEWFYTPTWKPTPLLQPQENSERRTWLLFIDGKGLGAGLARRLQDEMQSVVSVGFGSGFSRLDDGLYKCNPQSPNDVSALLQDLVSRDLVPDQVVQFIATPQDREAVFEEAGGQFENSRCFFQSWSKTKLEKALSYTVVNQVPAGPGSGQPEFPAALSPGLLRVIGQEMPDVKPLLLQVTAPDGPVQERKLLNHLWLELVGCQSERVVAYGNNRRWIEDYTALALESRETGIRKKGTYLVVGGLHGLGLEIADHLATNYQAHLVLTSSRPFVERQLWSDLERGHPDWETVQRLLTMEKAGAGLEVLILTTGRLGKWVTGAPTLNGVIYAQGYYGRQVFRTLAEMDGNEFGRHFEEKCPGLYELEGALGNRELDFCVILSSMAAILGGLGLGALAASHGLVDAFVKRHNQTHACAWTSMNWDGWVTLAGGEAAGSEAGELALSLAEGMTALERVAAAGGVDQIAVSSEDLPARLALLNRGPEKAAEAGEKQFTLHPRPHLQNPYVAPRNEIEEKIAAIWQARLGTEKVGIYDNFFELGGDSLIVVKIRNALKETFAQDLLTSDLFEFPTVAALAEHFSQNQAETSIKRARDRADKRRLVMAAGNLDEMFKPRRKLRNG